MTASNQAVTVTLPDYYPFQGSIFLSIGKLPPHRGDDDPRGASHKAH
jgi:hypothetical protein